MDYYTRYTPRLNLSDRDFRIMMKSLLHLQNDNVIIHYSNKIDSSKLTKIILALNEKNENNNKHVHIILPECPTPYLITCDLEESYEDIIYFDTISGHITIRDMTPHKIVKVYDDISIITD
jgi:hypothetical protein